MTIRISPGKLEDWAAAIFTWRGMPQAHAAAAVQAMVRSDLRGRATHGIARLKSYLEMIDEGLLNPAPTMRHEMRRGAMVFDADGALGHVAAPEITALGLQSLTQQASTLVVVRNIGHLGSLGIHALAAAEQGACCMAGQQTPPLLAIRGFKRAAIGNNPLAFACPMPGRDPFVFDMACSEAARGNILLAAREGRRIPADWALDESGEPTVDPQRALRGALLPAGGHKGLGIAMMVEILSAALAADADSLARGRPKPSERGGTSRVGAFFWFIDPAAFGSREAFDACMLEWSDYYSASAPEGGRLPGQFAAAQERTARETGVEISEVTHRELRALGDNAAVPFPV
jgi:LDH2 family malate/lactate/ureidoglycolate dehydrogenase